MSDPVDDRQRLLDLLDTFETTLADFTALVRELDEPEWEAPTDLAGWSVHDLVSHTAHLEAVIAGAPEETVPVPETLPHVTSLMGLYTEQGVIARKDRNRDELTDAPERFVVCIGDNGRGGPAADDVVPDSTLRMSTESFLLLSGGRRAAETQRVEIVGDQELGARFLAGLVVTP
ncbi:MAG: maleylpyruvate isomerase N-terminal domain-containing protein [Marmoricola sp.]